MDVETSAAIEQLAVRLDTLDVSLRTELRSVRDDLRAEFRDGLAENRRHAELLFETLHDDIRILAEGFAMISTKLDSLQR